VVWEEKARRARKKRKKRKALKQLKKIKQGIPFLYALARRKMEAGAPVPLRTFTPAVAAEAEKLMPDTSKGTFTPAKFKKFFAPGSAVISEEAALLLTLQNILAVHSCTFSGAAGVCEEKRPPAVAQKMIRGVQLLHDRLRGRDLPESFRMSPSSVQAVYDQLIRIHGNGYTPPVPLDVLFAQDDVLQRLAQGHTPHQGSGHTPAPASSSSRKNKKKKARGDENSASNSSSKAKGTGKKEPAAGSTRGPRTPNFAIPSLSEESKKRGLVLMKWYKGKPKFADVCHIFHAFGSCGGCKRSHACPLCPSSPVHSIAGPAHHAPHERLIKEAEA
jgi:hypothetical protein